MNKGTSTCLIVLALVIPVVSRAATHLGWADEFSVVDVFCENDNCSWDDVYADAGGTPYASRWQYVGAQGSDPAGRANAREEINFGFRDDSTGGCSTQTVQMTRYRTTSIPALGSSCDVSASYVGVASQTFDSCGFPLGDTYTQHRLLPAMNFSAETATNQAVGYRVVTTYTNSLGGGASLVYCYKIWWN